MSRRGSIFRRCSACGATTRQPRARSCAKCGAERLSWGFTVDLGPKGGPRKQRQKAGFRTKEDAQTALSELVTDAGRGDYVEPSKLTVGEYLTRWLEAVRGEYAPGTHDRARLDIERYIVPRIGEIKLQQLTSTDVKGLYANLRESGRLRGSGGLSESSIHRTHITLRRALSDAVEDRLLARNPAAGTHKQPEGEEAAYWTLDELRAFYAHVAEDRLLPLWRLAGFTGLRRGEIADLRWRNVDLDGGQLHLASQRAKGAGEVRSGRLKGKRGRTVALDPATVAALRTWRKRQAEERMAWPGEWPAEGWLFTHEDGSPLHPDSITKAFRKRVRNAGLPTLTFHGLRHSHAAHMLLNGTHPKIVQERLGHSSLQVTGDIYSHVSPGLQDAAAAQVAALIDQPSAEDEREADEQ